VRRDRIPSTIGLDERNDAMIRTAIIGVSGFGATHYNDLLREVEAGRLAATAATVINQDEEAEKVAALREIGATIYDDYAQMLRAHAGELELCMIPTGIALHEPMTVAALQAGANVLVEKPAAGTIQEVRTMQAAEAASGRFVAVGYQNMYDPVWRRLKERVQNGAIGQLRSVSGFGLWPRPDGYYARNNWAGRQRVGDRWVLDSPVNNAMAHFVMQTLFAAGPTPETRATPVRVEAELYRVREIENLDTACLRTRTAEGVDVYYAGSHCTGQHMGPTVELRGEDGTIRWTSNEAVIEKNGEEVETLSVLHGHPQREAIYDALCGRIRGEETFICDLEIAIGQTLLINAAQEAAPIRTIDPSHIERTETGGKHYCIIEGIEALAETAWRENKLFSEVGAPWTAAGGAMDLDGYDSFKGPKG
jgi:predicted dehydrogenase